MIEDLKFNDKLLQANLICQEFIIDSKHRFIFIPKTGSTSILELIAKNSNEEYYNYVQKRLEVGQSHAVMRYHTKLNKLDVRTLNPEDIDKSLIRYVTIRDPVKRFLSACDQVNFNPSQAIQHIKDFISKDRINKPGYNILKEDRKDREDEEDILDIHFYPQYSFLIPYNNLDIPLTLLKFPYSISFIKKEVNLLGDIPHVNKSKRDAHILSQDQIEFINLIYEKDIKLFNCIE